jgi:nucleotide sugar dehydrogenase
LVVIESTLVPGTIDELVVPLLESSGLTVGRDLLLGCAPRRDWFGKPARSLRTLPRIVGGTDSCATRAALDVLSICCERLITAPDHRHAELVKSVENAYRQMEITLAKELALAYPDLDIRTVLELVGTKWNVGTFHPSLGIGGYCIPLASAYILQGARRPELLSLLGATAVSSAAQARRVAEHLLARGDLRTVGILGLSYIADARVYTHSPSLQIATTLRDNAVSVKIHDPYYSADEIRQIAEVESFAFPDDLREFDAVLLVTGHREYRVARPETVLESLVNCRLIVDNADIWSSFRLERLGVEYHVPGDPGWLSHPDGASQSSPGASGL